MHLLPDVAADFKRAKDGTLEALADACNAALRHAALCPLLSARTRKALQCAQHLARGLPGAPPAFSRKDPHLVADFTLDEDAAHRRGGPGVPTGGRLRRSPSSLSAQEAANSGMVDPDPFPLYAAFQRGFLANPFLAASLEARRFELVAV